MNDLNGILLRRSGSLDVTRLFGREGNSPPLQGRGLANSQKGDAELNGACGVDLYCANEFRNNWAFKLQDTFAEGCIVRLWYDVSNCHPLRWGARRAILTVPDLHSC